MSNISIDELRRRFPNASASVLKRNSHGHQTVRKDRGPQEPKEDCGQKADHRPKSKVTHGGNYPQFRVRITFFYSDKRRIDLDGSANTLLDCLCSAVRRFLDRYPGTAPDRQAVRKRE